MQLDKSYFINQIEQYLLKMDKDEMKPYAVKVNYSGTKWYFLDAPDESEAEEVACEMFGNEIEQIYFDVSRLSSISPLIDFVRRIEHAHGIGVFDE